MPKKKIVIITVSVILLLLFLFRNKIFLPMGEQVKFSVELPKEMEISPLKVMYRSEICKASKPRSDGGSYKVPGYYYKEVIPSGNGDEYKYDITLNGWGICLWELSNVMIEISYKDLSKKYADTVIGSGVTFVFDNNSPQSFNGIYEELSGDVFLRKNFFPWVSNKKNQKTLWTYGGQLRSTYKTPQARNISFSVVSNTESIVYSKWPVDNKNREYTKYIYPDGDIVVLIDERPDYERLVRIKEHNNK
ncbi:hypothetical protein BIY28_03855 [Brenneria goodwinii]|nr:hypothetical protein BIY28_03855 [Brenneria goodwinii]